MNAINVGVSPARRFRMMDHIQPLVSGTHPTRRACAEDGCDNPALHVNGHYLVGERRVRVWVCKQHYLGNPNKVLPTPPNILEGMRLEQVAITKQERKYRWLDVQPERGVSIKTLASTGHGKVIHGDRVASFRWEPKPPSKRKRIMRKKAA